MKAVPSLISILLALTLGMNCAYANQSNSSEELAVSSSVKGTSAATSIKTEETTTATTAADKSAHTISGEEKPQVSVLEKSDQKSENIETAEADLKVLEFVLANKVESREPQGVVEAFDKTQERGFAFARLSSKQAGKVSFVWYKNGKEYTRQTMDVMQAKKWRTYSSVKLRSGEWQVKLLSEKNEVLAEKSFTLE